ncbi:hypothetical protein BGZ76_011614 [Entomortierella beljakovae]|nr:hypothetical protein BGZ76_011614 [Entomortierella beljakovae]
MSQINFESGNSLSDCIPTPCSYRPSVPDCDAIVKIEDETPTSENINAWDEFENLKLIYNPPHSNEPRLQKKSILKTLSYNEDLLGQQPGDSIESRIDPILANGISEPDNMSRLVSSYEEYRSKRELESMYVPTYPPNVSSISHESMPQDSPTLLLEDRDLWDKFHSQQNEMIITKSGRCLFPCLRFRAVNLDPEAFYSIQMDLEIVDPRRFRFSDGVWIPVDRSIHANDSSDEDSVASTILSREYYIHPSFCKNGKYWMETPISFSKVKLSNKFPDPSDSRIKINHNNGDNTISGSHIFHVLSFHMYRPRVSLIERSLDSQAAISSKCFTFDQTNFIAVTHYQNHNVNDLKKGFNPHAKGFRKKLAQLTPDHEGPSQLHQQQNHPSSNLSTPPTPIRYKKRQRVISAYRERGDDSSDSGQERKGFAMGGRHHFEDENIDIIGTKYKTGAGESKVAHTRSPNATIRMDDNNNIATITITNGRTTGRKLVDMPYECASTSCSYLAQPIINREEFKGSFVASSYDLAAGNEYQPSSLRNMSIQMYDSLWPPSEPQNNLYTSAATTVDQRQMNCISWYSQFSSWGQPSLNGPNTICESIQERPTTTSNWLIPKPTVGNGWQNQESGMVDQSNAWHDIPFHGNFDLSSGTPQAIISRSPATSLPPLLDSSEKIILRRTLLENNCLKAFIREKYGNDAEADANAVVAMQFHE